VEKERLEKRLNKLKDLNNEEIDFAEELLKEDDEIPVA